jgi:hypothetical protein
MTKLEIIKKLELSNWPRMEGRDAYSWKVGCTTEIRNGDPEEFRKGCLERVAYVRSVMNDYLDEIFDFLSNGEEEGNDNT